MKLNQDEYECTKCKEIWNWCPEDYENPWNKPVACPHCSMPVTQMIHDVYEQEGIREVIKKLYIRIKNI